jgi:hypothetical protein
VSRRKVEERYGETIARKGGKEMRNPGFMVAHESQAPLPSLPRKEVFGLLLHSVCPEKKYIFKSVALANYLTLAVVPSWPSDQN